jgi:predicted metal-dependent hydrolase
VNKASTASLFEQGRVLFNAGRHFEAHEAWEEAWRGESGATRLLLQGLIQIAAGYHKAFVQRQPRGCVRLLAAGLEKLRSAIGEAPDRGFEEFVERTQRHLFEAARWERGENAGLARAPRLDAEEGIH